MHLILYVVKNVQFYLYIEIHFNNVNLLCKSNKINGYIMLSCFLLVVLDLISGNALVTIIMSPIIVDL